MKTHPPQSTPPHPDSAQWRMLEHSSSAFGDPSKVESRRDFLKLFALSLGASQLAACARAPDDPIVPAVRAAQQDEDAPTTYATALERDGYACGVFVKTRYGHPIKIEGNPAHPASLGGTDVFAQAAIFSLWDADRARNVTRRGQIATWADFGTTLAARLDALPAGGKGLCILSEPSTSPTQHRQRGALGIKYPDAKWFCYGSLPRDNIYAGMRTASGAAREPFYDFSRAEIVVALDADFLTGLPGAVRYARDFAAQRDPFGKSQAPGSIARLYVAAPTPGPASALADHRLVLRAADVGALAAAILAAVDGAVASNDAIGRWVRVVAADLATHRGAGIVVAGDQQPALVHRLVHEINERLGNVGATVHLGSPLLIDATAQCESLRALCAAIESNSVDTLLILGGNPVYTAPADCGFGELLGRVPWTAHLGLREDETSFRCGWQLPQAHELESWGDLRAYDGSACISQPAIAPLHGGKSLCELVDIVLGGGRSGFEIVRETWRLPFGNQFDARWEYALRSGVIENGFDAVSPAPIVDSGATTMIDSVHDDNADAGDGELEILFRPDTTIGDGRHAGNAWLQELPKPVTDLTWDNAALISPATATRLGLADEDVVEIRVAQRRLQVPVLVQAGHADDCVVLPLGYGRTRAGRVGSGLGFDAGQLRTFANFWRARGTLTKTVRTYPFARTQRHHRIDGLTPVRRLALSELATAASATAPQLGRGDTLYPDIRRDGYAWGMAINLGACIGCKACTIACQAENNIPVVGKQQVRRGREMHWIRVDGYYEGAAENPRLHFQPVPCMHCEKAPCEVVCPVGATVHDSEGLNLQVYNRCVGTRFCANNCPYKVRRFNFLKFVDAAISDFANPDVTVRGRGVMEKCTYCIQRIETARIGADRDDRRLGDGAVVTACQAACPTGAIIFGDLNDPLSAVSLAKADRRNYALLAELNTAPRTTYLAKIDNPNPDMEA